MIVDLPSSTTSAVNKKLVELRESGGVLALGRVLTLVIVTDDGGGIEQAIEAGNSASREHPCRVIVLARGQRRAAPRLDAQIRVGGDAGASEVVVLRGYGPLAADEAGAGMVMPLLLPDAPVVAWWPGEAPNSPSQDAVGRLAQRRITDSLSARNPIKAFDQRRASHVAGDTDLVWTRLTHWRALLASALDFPPHEAVTSATVSGEAVSPSTDLMAGWLAARLGVKVRRAKADHGAGMVSVSLERPSGRVELVRPDGRTGMLRQPGQPDRMIALARRTVPDCLAEELRRLDPDDTYGEALAAIGQVSRGRSTPPRPAAPTAGSRRLGPGGKHPDGGPGTERRAGARTRRVGGLSAMTQRDIVVHADQDVLAAAAAARLVTRLVDVQAAGRVPRLVLTGGGVGTALLEQLAHGPARDAVDWAHVEFYWGDERFVAPDDPERNEVGARQALLDHLPVDPQRVHAMGADTGTGPSGAEAAAEEYAALLARHARPEDHGPVPAFDVTLLGMGGEGHTASVFPHSPAVYETERTVVAVHGCPKPPPDRVSLTLPALRRSAEVWILATGDAKAAAVAMALGGAGEVAIPVAGATGTRRTLWLLDRAAAAKLPRDLTPRIA